MKSVDFQALWEKFRAYARELGVREANNWPEQWEHWNSTLKPAVQALMDWTYQSALRDVFESDTDEQIAEQKESHP